MISSHVRRAVGALVIAAVAANVSSAADDSRSKTDSGKAPANAAAQKGGTARGSGKGPLPDPILLDGSTQQAEKKSEHGMIGEFELPGDENVRSGKVGGPQNPNAGAAGGQNNMPMGMPQGGGGGGPQGQQPPSGAQAQGGQQA